jgi:proteic killer suppression protein
VAHVIQSFRCKRTEELFTGVRCHRPWRAFQAVAERKLAMLAAATTINDLRSPPGNRLEALQGDRAGQHSIRINDQYRVCFTWTDKGPSNVEIVDYH